jgi:hypothetical protein
MKKGAKPKETQSPIRTSEALKKRIRAYQRRVEERTGFKITLSAAIRDLIEKGLEVAS